MLTDDSTRYPRKLYQEPHRREHRGKPGKPHQIQNAANIRGRSSAPTKPKLGRLQLHDVAYGHFGPFATALTAVKIDPAFRAFVTRNEAYDPASVATL